MNKVEKIKAELERRIAEIRDISQGYIADKQMSTEYLLLHELLSFIDSLSDTEKDFSIKESVIPFGASDSELMEATYFIPQGYHAVIEGDKVIIKKGEDSVSNDLEEAATSYARKQLSNPDYPTYNDEYEMECAFEAGANYVLEQVECLLKDKNTGLVEMWDKLMTLVEQLKSNQ